MHTNLRALVSSGQQNSKSQSDEFMVPSHCVRDVPTLPSPPECHVSETIYRGCHRSSHIQRGTQRANTV